MSAGPRRPAGRDVGMAWGMLAELCLLPVVAVWAGSADATEHAVFGRIGALALVSVALCVVPVGAVITVVVWAGARDWSGRRRWAVAGPLLLLSVALVVSGVGSLSGAGGVGAMLGWLLLVGAVAMVGLVIQLVRVRATGSRDRLRQRFTQLRAERDGSP